MGVGEYWPMNYRRQRRGLSDARDGVVYCIVSYCTDHNTRTMGEPNLITWNGFIYTWVPVVTLLTIENKKNIIFQSEMLKVYDP